MDCANSSAHQQFCLRWHNHQASLLSTLPLLLDQSHLTDVTLSAGGKTLQAHRVVLSACSTFFSELFRTLDSSLHPVIVIPGASLGTLVALLTFMYSGEVNVFEEQIPTLLAIAETLGIKGLADFQSNFQNSSKVSPSEENSPLKETSCPLNPLAIKIPSPLENFFIKSFHLLPNLMPQPLNFSQSALNKTSEILTRYYQHCNILQQSANEEQDNSSTDKIFNKDILSGEAKYVKDVKKIDKIAENLRCTNSNGLFRDTTAPVNTISSSPSLLISNKSSCHSVPSHLLMKNKVISKTTQDEKDDLANAHSLPNFNQSENLEASKFLIEKTINSQQKPTSSKLYATCFICHKQLSNQYNLRVHLETHQNIRYACSVCSHVSRSKDALRKHVSYRHPGAPSPCETDTRRKRPKPTALAPVTVETTKPDNEDKNKNQSNISNQPPHMYMQSHFQNTIQYPTTCENSIHEVNSKITKLDQPRST